MTARQAHRRYLILLALRWLPVGLYVPVTVLLPLDRGLSLAEVGAAMSVQGFVVLGLELPTGGLADSWGRRPVLVLSGALAAASFAVLFVADSLAAFVVVAALQGIHRALDSGPLEAWYVDATLAANPTTRLERGLSAGATVLSLGIGLGALLAGGLIAWVDVGGVDALVVPIALAFVITVVSVVATVVLLTEPRRARRGAGVRGVVTAIGGGARLVRRSRVLAALIAVELFWGFGMVTFEQLMPVRLAAETSGTETAAAIMGPAAAVGWLASAAGAALAPAISARIGVATTAIVLRLAQGLAVVGMGLLAGVVGVLTGFLLAYVVHGAANPMHTTLLHREVAADNRATVLSLNSMVAQPAGSVGLIVLLSLSGATSVSTAIVVGAIVLAIAAPLYLPARRAEQRAREISEDVPSPGVAVP
ncbi:MAG: MFS transporter [Actinophytocola sp.]|nr:MFS transporter [Actinophytocola sp.]